MIFHFQGVNLFPKNVQKTKTEGATTNPSFTTRSEINILVNFVNQVATVFARTLLTSQLPIVFCTRNCAYHVMNIM